MKTGRAASCPPCQDDGNRQASPPMRPVSTAVKDGQKRRGTCGTDRRSRRLPLESAWPRFDIAYQLSPGAHTKETSVAAKQKREVDILP